DVRLGRLQYVINGPEMHRWHHALDRDAYQKNFATKLAIWDWLFATAFFPDPAARKASRYGSGNERFPDGYWRQQLYALRRRRLPRSGMRREFTRPRRSGGENSPEREAS